MQARAVHHRAKPPSPDTWRHPALREKGFSTFPPGWGKVETQRIGPVGVGETGSVG